MSYHILFLTRASNLRRVALPLSLATLAACDDATPTRTELTAPTPVPAFARGGSGDNNGRILFASTRDDPAAFEIYSMNPDGTGVSRLTNSPGHDMSPAWSPDGKRVAFVSVRHDPDGEIYVMNADGTGVSRLTYSAGVDGSPAWSKDGKRIAFVSMRGDPAGDIYIMNDDGTGVTPVTDFDGLDRDPAWSPDGKQIAFVSSRDALGAGTSDLYVLTLDGRQVDRLTVMAVNVHDPSWAPGGKQLAFHFSFDPGDADILTTGVFVVSADGTLLSRLTDGPGDGGQESAPSWSPDGKFIAFQSIRDGDVDIYVMNADGTGLSRLTTSPAEDVTPAWNR